LTLAYRLHFNVGMASKNIDRRLRWSSLGILAVLTLASACGTSHEPLPKGDGSGGASGGTGGAGGQGTGGTAGGTGGAIVCERLCPNLPVCVNGYQPNPEPCGCPICPPVAIDGGSADARVQAATIEISRSTNSPEIDVVVYSDGSADRTVVGTGGVNSTAPKTFSAGSPEGTAFLSDLAAVGDVSAIPTGACAKSVSFGTVTTISAGGKTSGDLQCLEDPSAADTALVAAGNALTSSP
jgi:hypothetical protein